MMLGLGLVFMNGHPFERRTLAIVGTADSADPSIAAVRMALASFEEVRVEIVPNEAVAMGKLRARMANAVILLATEVRTPSLRLIVGPRDQLFGRGLAEVLPDTPRVEVLDVPKWGYVQYLFPGALAFSVLLSGLFGMGYALVLSRQNGFLKKLATTPMGKATFIGAQITSRALLVLVQLALLITTAWIGFGMRFSPAAILWAGVISALGLLTFLGLGFALACLIRTEDLVVDVISAVNIPLILLSELFFPLDTLPRWLSAFGSVLPSTQMVRLLRAVLLYGVDNIASVAPGLGVMALWMVAGFGLSLRVFKWHA
ncbi:MAG: ABC transporter permease [Deltaproteobacteria bacterium]|nr:ABC transporter permease [Deltaproteobacteria bacterium]